MKKCGKGCPSCPYIKEGKYVKKKKKKNGNLINHMIVINIMWFMQSSARKRNVRKHI